LVVRLLKFTIKASILCTPRSSLPRKFKFEQALRENPDFAEAHNSLGFTLHQQGPQNYARVLEHYNKAIHLKPSVAETYEYRGVLFAKMGKKTEAEKDLAALKQLNQTSLKSLGNFSRPAKKKMSML
jgi:tetratricopeptide (TPR) repeat protein